MTALTPPKSRNDPCPCGSGRRYKACHGAPVSPVVAAASTSAALFDLMQRSLAAQLAGDNAAAEALYRQALSIDPDEPDCLHMLGVVRMSQLDLAEARTLIRRAGEATGWTVPEIRHNYGYVLSTLLAGREPGNLPRRIDRIRQQRLTRAAVGRCDGADTPAFDLAVVVVADAGAPEASIRDTLAGIETLEQRPLEVVLVTSGDSVPPPNLQALPLRPRLQRADDAGAVAALAAALADCRSPFVLLLAPGDRMLPGVWPAVAHLASLGARWGVARCQARPDTEPMLPAPVLANAFSALAGSARLGAALFADVLVNRASSNLLWQREFLLECLSAYPRGLDELVAEALWLDEPAYVDDTVLHFSAPITEGFWSASTAAADRYLLRALAAHAPGNPLAPCAALDGPGFLKRPLRLGLGKRVSPAMLARIVDYVDSAPIPSGTLAADGIELIGFVRAEIGLGESLRLLASACAAAGVPRAVVNIPLDMGVRQTNNALADSVAEQPRFRTRVICANPDTLAEGNFIDGALGLPDAYDIGYWYWELEQMPASWAAHGAIVDELWVATEFVAAAARRLFDRPVFTLPPPILPLQPVRAFSRSEFGLSDGDFVFMFSFDMGSFPARKNPHAVIDAFCQAFPPSVPDVALVIKCQRGHTFPAAYERLRASVASDRRIHLVETTMSRETLTGLQSVVDSYVSLHRAEGLGLGLAEAMALGKPVIGTGYSGNLDFMNEHNALLVNYHLIPLTAEDYIEWRGQHWAAADSGHAAAHMRRLYEDRSFARALGERGRATILKDWSPVAAGSRIRARLDAVNASLAGRTHVSARVRRLAALRGAAA